MDNLNKTLFTNSEDDLKKIYEDEHKRFLNNQLIMDCVEKMTIQDFRSDIPEESKKNIENALLAVRISDFIDLGNGQTLLDLENFKLSKISLSYSEQKQIREKIQYMVNNEIKRKMTHSSTDSLEKKIANEQSKFIRLEKENREMMLKLEELKREAFELMNKVVTVFIGFDQKEIVNGLREETELLELKTRKFKQITENHECNRTKYSHNVLKEISSYLDELIAKKNNEK